jgi:hypothetical protein
MTEAGRHPILAHKHYAAHSVFTPEKLLREARRQKGLAEGELPRICILDPEGDIVQHLVETGLARRNLLWACN